MSIEIFIGETRISSDNTSQPTLEEEKRIEAAKKRWGVFENAQDKFTKTLEASGYTLISKLENGVSYPTVDDWVNLRGLQLSHIRFYPAFVRDMSGTLFFCKARIANKLDYNPGLGDEADVLRVLPPE